MRYIIRSKKIPKNTEICRGSTNIKFQKSFQKVYIVGEIPNDTFYEELTKVCSDFLVLKNARAFLASQKLLVFVIREIMST